MRPLISTLIGVRGNAFSTSVSVGTRKSLRVKPFGGLRFPVAIPRSVYFRFARSCRYASSPFANQYAPSSRWIWRSVCEAIVPWPFVVRSSVVSCETTTLPSSVTPTSSSSMSAPGADGALEGVERVRRELVLAALVGDVEDALGEPRVGLGVGGGGGGERQHDRGQEDATHRLVSMAEADRLYAVPLEDFVDERKRLARELRAAGDKDAAAAVAKFPKPTPPAWALNLLAREAPDAVGDWLAAAEALRDASARPGKGLREAMAAHRDATRALVALARERAQPGGKALSESMLERVRALLQEATADEDRAEALRAGLVVEGGDAPPPARTKEARAAKARGRRRPRGAPPCRRGAGRRAGRGRGGRAGRRARGAGSRRPTPRSSGCATSRPSSTRPRAPPTSGSPTRERTLRALRVRGRRRARRGERGAAATTAAAERDLRRLTRQLRGAPDSPLS